MTTPEVLAQLATLLQIRQQVAPDFMERDNVVACGVGYKIKGDEQTAVPSIVVSVTQKKPASALSPADMIPPTIHNVLTDVVETGEIVAHGFVRTVAVRPLRPGTSLGLMGGSTGTLGCIVRKGGLNLILSNNHVLAALNQASLGAAIVQPGPADGGTLANQVGTLVEFVPIAFLEPAPSTAAAASAASQSTPPQGFAAILTLIIQALADLFSGLRQPTTALPPPPLEPPANRVDAALALPVAGMAVDPAIVDLGAPPTGIADAQLGTKVFKSGRSSGVTEATITQIDVTVNVRYGDQMARFANQIITTPFSQPGDSGSLTLDFQRNAVGLLFAGSDQVSVLNPINQVLAALGAELVTGATAGGPGADMG